jgi:hypothetical protein
MTEDQMRADTLTDPLPGVSRMREATTVEEVLAKLGPALGFVSLPDVRLLAAHPKYRLQAILVRCGAFRLTAPAQDIEAIVHLIEREGTTYVRDMSVPTSGQGVGR